MFVKEFIMAFKSLLDLDVPRNFNIGLLQFLNYNTIAKTSDFCIDVKVMC